MRLLLLAACTMLVACGCGGAPPAPATAKASGGPDVRVEQVSTAAAPKSPNATRVGLSALVGPEGDFAVFRDQRRLALGRGTARVSLRE
jgi:hypothetical protein